MNILHNIDDVRAEIMRLENATIFVQADWDRVQAALIEQGRTAGLADCQRRMQTALHNAEWIGGVDLATGEDAVGYFVPVAVETEDLMLKAYWVQVKDDDCGAFIHAESHSQAKSLFLKEWPLLDTPEWTDLRARRCRGLLDDVPFTDDSIRIAGYDAQSDEFEDSTDSFLETCPCSMCKAEKAKSVMEMAVR